jgi:hypothetical protein
MRTAKGRNTEKPALALPRQWEKGNAVAMDLMQPGLDKYWNL